jgi:glycyl-tRNA synthetase beta chain
MATVAGGYEHGDTVIDDAVVDEVTGFVWDRVAALLAEEGVGVRTVRAATAGRPSVVLAARRAHLLRALAGTEAFAELLTLYKRAANLAENASEGGAPDPSLFEAEQEAPLFEALPAARSGAGDLLDELRRQLPAWQLGAGPARKPSPGKALARVLALKDPLDRFLDGVLVMVDDPALRNNRLALLREVSEVLAELGALEELRG